MTLTAAPKASASNPDDPVSRPTKRVHAATSSGAFSQIITKGSTIIASQSGCVTICSREIMVMPMSVTGMMTTDDRI